MYPLNTVCGYSPDLFNEDERKLEEKGSKNVERWRAAIFKEQMRGMESFVLSEKRLEMYTFID